MGASLTVLEIEDISKEKFQNDEFEVETQTSFLDHEGIETKKLGKAKTIVEKTGREDGYIQYHVSMSSDTKKNPIYIYMDELKPYEKGYQEIKKFEFWVDEEFQRMYVFAPKSEVKTFIRRLDRENHISTKPRVFDFTKIEELEDLDSGWGTWEDSEGIVRRIAKFGKGIEEELDEEDYESITTFYIDYYHGTEIVSLILGENGRISTKEGLDDIDLFNIYQKIEGVLVSDKI